MGLFDWFKSRREDDEEIDLAQFSGMRLEVMDTKERLLFIARVGVSWEGGMELRPATPPRIRPEATDYPVLLRGYQEETRKAVHMEGTITPRKDGNFSVANVRVTSKDNDRAFYRQGTAVSGEVVPLRQQGVLAKPCRLVNVSAGGVCIQTEDEYKMGEKLLLKTNLLREWSVTPLLCEVCRGVKKRGYYEYGCEFLDITPQMEELISKAITQMQMRQMHPYQQ